MSFFLKHLFPKNWSKALIIPILKPGKDPLNPKSYRPISLLSCLYKILDTIINNRLIWFLEKNSLLDKCQSGGRKNRNTMDHVCTITTEIQEAFALGKYHISIFLDLENAYDKSWKNHILQQLQNFKMSGHLPLFIQNFLTDRSIKVNVNNCKSDSFKLEMGIPQGSSLSATLFLVAINCLVDKLPSYIYKSLFVDDCRVSIMAYDLKTAEEKLQKVLNTFEKWCEITGFSFSTTKTKVLIFHRKKRAHPPKISLFLNQELLECVTEFKFLGVILDSKLTWAPHLMKIKQKSFKNINLLKIISSSKFKTSTKNLLNIYKVINLTRIEYGSIAYHTAAPSRLKLLDPIHHKCLRICLGAFRTTPIHSLYVESNIPSLETRRKIACIQYYFRSQEIPQCKTSINIHDHKKDLIFRHRKQGPFPIGMIIRKYLKDFDIGTPKIILKTIPPNPPWMIPEINLCFELNKTCKKDSTPFEHKQSFLSHRHNCNIEMYTDGSKTTIGTGGAVCVFSVKNQEYNSFQFKINKLCSVFTAEMKAIRNALKSIISIKNSSCTIYSDSKSSLLALNQFNPKIELLKEIHGLIYKISFQNSTLLTFCWIPSHCGITGNEHADKYAKLAANVPRECILPISASDMKPHIKNQIFSFWSQEWNSLTHNKLKNNGAKIEEKSFNNFYLRIDEIKFTRLRLGHTRLTHSHFFNGNIAPICAECQTPYTVNHILCRCPRFENERLIHLGDLTLTKQNILQFLNRSNPCKNRNLIEFLKSANLFTEI